MSLVFLTSNCVNTHSATTERIDLSNGRDFSQRDYCALARQQTPGMKVDNLMHSVINDDLQVMAVKRLPDPNNEFVGFAAVSLRLGFFRKWLERLHLQAGGEVMIVDANRRLIAVSPSAPERVGESDSERVVGILAGRRARGCVPAAGVALGWCRANLQW